MTPFKHISRPPGHVITAPEFNEDLTGEITDAEHGSRGSALHADSHARQHALDSTDHLGEITDTQHGTRGSGLHGDSHGRGHALDDPLDHITSDHHLLEGLEDDDHSQYVLRNILTTHGDLFFRNAAGIARLAPGTLGQFLRTQGPGADPQWVDPPSYPPGYTTKDIKCYPRAAAGPTCASPATAWTWGAWVQLVPAGALTDDYVITHLISLEDPVAAVDVSHQMVFELGTGIAGSEVVIASLAVTYRIDSAVGHLSPWIIPLPVPRRVTGNPRVAIRCTDSIAAARTYGGNKIQYIELPYT